MSEAFDDSNILILTADIVAAYVSNNSVKPDQLVRAITETYASLAALTAAGAAEDAGPEFTPAVTVRKSLGRREVILSMIDGKPYKLLRRHLTTHGLTPAEYRARYNLPKDYPMVAPAYSEMRRDTAKRLGLGRKLRAAVAARTDVPEKRGRKPAAKAD
jgi:predicted transcriptional regulator